MTYSYANVQGQWSGGSEDRVETNGRTNGRTDGRAKAIALPAALMRSVIKQPSAEFVPFGKLTERRKKVDVASRAWRSADKRISTARRLTVAGRT